MQFLRSLGQNVFRRAGWVAALLLITPTLAVADQVDNDLGNKGSLPTVAVDEWLEVDYWLIATSGGQDLPGCNVGPGNPGVLSFAALDPEVTLQVTSLSFEACDTPETLRAKASGPGAFWITASIAAPGKWSWVGGAQKFQLKVAAAPADLTPPVLTLPGDIVGVEATGPGGAVVTFSASAVDAVDGPVAVTCTPASGATFPLGTTVVACSATDAAGNPASGSFSITVVDTTPPEWMDGPVLASTLSVPATSSAGAPVSFAPTAYDLVSLWVTPQCSPASGSVFPLGVTPVTCTATDAAGNSADPLTFSVHVAYEWSGFLEPFVPGKVHKLGSTIPVKFRLVGDSAGITDATARLFVTCGAAGEMPAVSTSSATTGNLFRYDPVEDQYVFQLTTKGLPPGACQARADLGDGVQRVHSFMLR